MSAQILVQLALLFHLKRFWDIFYVSFFTKLKRNT